jgi:hypothetical protein
MLIGEVDFIDLPESVNLREPPVGVQNSNGSTGTPTALHRFSFTVAGVDVGKCLPVGVAGDTAAGHPVGAPGWRKAAGRLCDDGKIC